MSVPTNLTALTAIDLGVLPADVTQDVHDTGTGLNYTVWYKFTTPSVAKVVGAWGFSGNIGAGYRPNITSYDGPASAPSAIVSSLTVSGSNNKPIQFPVNPSTEYFLEFVKNVDTSPALLRIRVEVAPNQDLVAGSIIVPDDTSGLPASVISIGNGTVRSFVNPFPAGEQGDILSVSGRSLVSNIGESGLNLYEKDLTLLVAQIPLSEFGVIRANQGSQKFYTAFYNGGTNIVVNTVSSAGVIGGTTYTVTGGSIAAIAALNNDTILYYSEIGNNKAIKRWDLIGNVALTDFVAGVANYRNCDILVLSDSTILVCRFKSTAARDVTVTRYNTSGTILNTYTFGAGPFISVNPRFAYAINDPTSFWAFLHLDNAVGDLSGKSRFVNVRVSDGVALNTIEIIDYHFGIYSGVETATPPNRFGPSTSCPLFILRGNSGIYVISPGKTNDTVWPGASSTLDVKIPNPLVQTAFTDISEGENINHFAGIRIRVNGTGNLIPRLLSLDSILTQTLASIVMSTTTDRQPTILANFQTQRCSLELKTTVINEIFKINRIILYAKEVFSEFPSVQ